MPIDLPGVDVDVHTPTGEEIFDKVVNAPPGVDIDMDMNPDLDELLDDLEKVHDFFSPFGNDDEAKAMLDESADMIVATKALIEKTKKRYKSTGRNTAIAFLLAVYIGSR